jgi:hypothetical protein
MKNQNDLIISVAAAVVGIIAIVLIAVTQPQTSAPAAPTAVDVSTPKLPAGSVVYANGLGGGGNGGGGMGGMMGGMPGGMMGGMPGMGAGKRGMMGMGAGK